MRTERGHNRRQFLRLTVGAGAGAVLIACTAEPPGGPGDPDPEADAASAGGPDASSAGGDASPASPDAAACTTTVILYDVYAMALYFDGGLGPRAGTEGGQVMFEGTVEGLRASDTLTGHHLDDRDRKSVV